MKQLFLFDLDGTVTESGPGIKKSVAYALEAQGITKYTEEQLDLFVGPPLRSSFKDLFGMTEAEAQQGVRDYRTYYEKNGIFDNSVYAGMEELLAYMKRRGMLCGIASSKPERFVLDVLEHYHIRQYFDVIAGASMGEDLVEKPDIIRLALQRAYEDDLLPADYPARDNSPAVWMVGDRRYDVEGAHACGLPVIGVCYGYGARAELEEAGADLIAETVDELRVLIGHLAEKSR